MTDPAVSAAPATATTRPATCLQAVLLWWRRPIGYALLPPTAEVSVGSAKRATFAASLPAGYPRRHRLVRRTPRGFRLRLGPGMTGQIQRAGQVREVASYLAEPGPKRLFGGPSLFRDVDIAPGDAAQIVLIPESDLRLQLTFTEAPPRLPPPGSHRREPLLFRVGAATFFVLAALVAVLTVIGGSDPRDPPLALTAEQVAVILPPEPPAAPEARKKKDQESPESKRMKDKAGKTGREDEKNKDTILPKGKEDIIREKVAQTGVLGILGRSKAAGSGLAKLFERNDTAEMDQAISGLAGAQLVAGQGSQGATLSGTGLGGGGTGFGRIQATGDVNVGAGRGRGKKGPSLGTGTERTVQAGLETGNPDAEGGLTKEQINRVVRAHQSAVKYCYEKELQRSPQLAGKIEIFWIIRTDGTVERAKVASSTVGNAGVEGCIVRQVQNWVFPKSDGRTIVQSYPFLFKSL